MNENALSTVLYLALFIITVAVFANIWLRRQQSRSIGGKGLRLIQRLPLGPREQAVLIEVAGERMLLGVTAHQIQLLCSFRHCVESNGVGTKVQKTSCSSEVYDQPS